MPHFQDVNEIEISDEDLRAAIVSLANDMARLVEREPKNLAARFRYRVYVDYLQTHGGTDGVQPPEAWTSRTLP
jgi:hypothetical protein